MSPNPLDVQTIHASQNDGEAREWEFELHNNGELIDTSNVTEQLFFKAYKGGTEQLLPENTSTPTTSPFDGTIKYPSGSVDSYFTYRESPTEEDGLAKITDIKGNTLVWNQLVQNGNFADGTDNWTGASATLSASNGELTVTIGGAWNNDTRQNLSLVAGHKYLGCLKAKSDTITSGVIFGQFGTQANITFARATTLSPTYQTIVGIATINESSSMIRCTLSGSGSSYIGQSYTIKDVMLFDLTQMGLDITDPSDFTSLFSLPYYDFNQGSLLSFNGNGIKTVSKNQFDTQVVTTSYAGLVLTKTQGTIRAVYSGGSQYAGFNFYGSPVFTDTFLKGKYRLSFDVKGLDTQWIIGLRRGVSFLGGGQAPAISNDGHYSFTIDAEANPNCYLSFARTGNKTTAYDVTFSNIQLELGTTETPYTPFEEQTISLPISQYFPDGMDGVGTAHDELGNSGYVKRMWQVDLGSLAWNYSNGVFISTTGVGKTQVAHSDPTIVCPLYTAKKVGYNVDYADEDKVIWQHPNSSLRVRDSAYTSATAFKTAMSGVYLRYELATPLENYGVVDLGSLTWYYDSSNNVFHTSISDMVTITSQNVNSPLLCSIYATGNSGYYSASRGDKTIWSYVGSARIVIKDASYSTVDAFKQAMQGVYLLYEKENPQGFTTATLVTENGDVALANENGVLVGKCNSDVSADAGFIEGKIKLSDEDGDVYSNKLQLHVERSPQ